MNSRFLAIHFSIQTTYGSTSGLSQDGVKFDATRSRCHAWARARRGQIRITRRATRTTGLADWTVDALCIYSFKHTTTDLYRN